MTYRVYRGKPRLLTPVLGAGHTYSLDGRPLVGVTSVIHTVLRAPQLEEWFKKVGRQADTIRDEAAAFGSSIHAGLASYASGTKLLPLDLPPDWWTTVEAGRRWIDENLEEIYAVEEPIASARYGYGSNSGNSPALEALLTYVQLFLTSMNPVATALSAQDLLVSRQVLGFWTKTLSDGSTIPMLSPWISFTILYLGASAVLVVLTIRRTRSVEV